MLLLNLLSFESIKDVFQHIYGIIESWLTRANGKRKSLTIRAKRRFITQINEQRTRRYRIVPSGAFDRRATRWQIYPCSVEMGAGPSSSYYPQLHGVRKQIERERERFRRQLAIRAALARSGNPLAPINEKLRCSQPFGIGNRPVNRYQITT